MIIDCIADLHGYYPKLDGGDLLIVGGDLTARDTINEHNEFCDWLDVQPYSKKIVIAGNHDHRICEYSINSLRNCVYLFDSGTEFEKLKIWGCPYSLYFSGVNPKCAAFMYDEDKLKEKYDLIPDNIDILVSHSPPYGILDESDKGTLCGSRSLRDTLDRIKPMVLVCGHIHEQGSKSMLYKHQGPNTWCVNASYVNEHYQPVNKPMRIEL